ncbi:MAG: c-type cytochrome [Candidatus Methylomirabilales bacterium]
MREKVQMGSLALASIFLLALPAWGVKPLETPEQVTRGRAIFEQSCILCHGATGEGDGPAAFFIASYGAPRPQNFHTDNFKFRSTPSGMLPTDDDLFRTLTRGVPGFMPSFAGLNEQERWQVIYYIKSFNPKFQTEKPENVEIKVGHPHLPTPGHLARGRKLYRAAGCGECHGKSGRGDGEKADALKDYRGFPIRPTDLTNPTAFKNGSSQEDIYRTIMTGLNGTPMPSYADAFEGMEDDIWHMVHYILSLSKR